MQIAMVGASSPPDEANGLRRAMATFRHDGEIHLFATSSSAAWSRTATNAISPNAASSQIEGFGTYGFPESHAASFSLLVYVSAWIKCHHPDGLRLRAAQ